MSTSNLLQEFNSLRSVWQKRNLSIRKSYDTIRLRSDLKKNQVEQEEVVVSTDPRTTYNMANFLLTPGIWSFQSDYNNLNPDEELSIRVIQAYAQAQLASVVIQTRSTLFGNVISRMIRRLTATGWYSVIAVPDVENGWTIGVWNPVNVYPEYSEYGELIKVAHIYTTSKAAALQSIYQEGWFTPRSLNQSRVTFKHLWYYDSGQVMHAVMIDSEIIKPPTPTPFIKIPVYVMPAGGLPDDGSITNKPDWREDLGQNIVSTIEELQKNLDRSLSFLQNAVKDASDPTIIEQTDEDVLPQDTYGLRGLRIRVGPGENVRTLETPVFPPEIHLHHLTLRGMIQRSTFSDSIFGVGPDQVSVYAASTNTASSQQVLSPYEDAVKNLWGDIATDLVQADIRHGILVPPADLPDRFSLRMHYEVDIPGDFVNRANIARILNPEFRLSSATIIDNLFASEIESAAAEFAKIQAEENLSDERYKAAVTQIFLERAAAQALNSGDIQLARAIQAQLQQGNAQTTSAGNQVRQELNDSGTGRTLRPSS